MPDADLGDVGGAAAGGAVEDAVEDGVGESGVDCGRCRVAACEAYEGAWEDAVGEMLRLIGQVEAGRRDVGWVRRRLFVLLEGDEEPLPPMRARAAQEMADDMHARLDRDGVGGYPSVYELGGRDALELVDQVLARAVADGVEAVTALRGQPGYLSMAELWTVSGARFPRVSRSDVAAAEER